MAGAAVERAVRRELHWKSLRFAKHTGSALFTLSETSKYLGGVQGEGSSRYYLSTTYTVSRHVSTVSAPNRQVHIVGMSPRAARSHTGAAESQRDTNGKVPSGAI